MIPIIKCNFYVMLLLIFLCTWIVNISAQLVENGNCIDVPEMKNFQPKKFLGLWYEVGRLENEMQLYEKCTQYTITIKKNRTLRLQGQTMNIISGARQYWEATAIPKDEYNAKFELIFPPYGFIKTINATIIDTDYDKYAVTCICEDEDGYSLISINILSRTKKFQDKYVSLIINIMTRYKLPFPMLIATDQDDCPQ